MRSLARAAAVVLACQALSPCTAEPEPRGSLSLHAGSPRLPADQSPVRPLAFDGSLMRLDHVIGSATGEPAEAGLQALDVDHDGQLELLVGHEEAWYLLAFEPVSGEWRQTVYVQCGDVTAHLEDVAAGDLDGDGEYEIVSLHGGQYLEVHDARSGELEQRFDLDMTAGSTMLVGDLASGGGDEVAIACSPFDPGELHVYRVGEPLPVWSIPDISAQDMALGQTDGDSSLELVVSDGNSGGGGWVIDVDDRRVEWQEPATFGAFVATEDLDGDGVDEILAGHYSTPFVVHDGVTRSERWRFEAGGRVKAIAVSDTQGDGQPEIYISQDSGITVLDGSTGEALDWMQTPLGGTLEMVIADVDSDCEDELVWGTTYAAENALSIADVSRLELEHQRTAFGGHCYRLGIGDVDVDGRPELVVVNRNVSQCRVVDLNRGVTRSHDVGWVGRGVGMALLNLDADAQLEYVIDAAATVKAWDALTFQQEWESESWAGEEISCVQSADVDGDGSAEILVGTGTRDGPPDGAHLRVLDSASGALRWQSPIWSGTRPAVLAADAAQLDLDPATEVVSLSATGVRVYDWDSGLEEWSESIIGASALRLDDWDGDGDLELLVGVDDGSLLVLDMRTRAIEMHAGLATGPLNCIRLADLDGDGARELIVAAGERDAGRVRVHSLPDLGRLWESPPLAGTPGRGDSMQVADADDDGRLELVVAVRDSVSVFEYGAPVPDLDAPTWPGAVGLSSAVSPWTRACCPTIDLAWQAAMDEVSPPLRYRVYRDVVPSFVPGPENLVAETRLHSYRDVGLEPDMRYSFVVRAVDRAGNEDGNTNTMSAWTVPATPPNAVDDVIVSDEDECRAAGVTITFSREPTPHELSFDLEVDGVIVEQDIASPHVWVPPDEQERSYRVVTRYLACPLATASNLVRAADRRAQPAAPARGVRLTDPDPCRQGLGRIRFQHGGFDGSPGHHELWRDGILIDADIRDGSEFVIPDVFPHDYYVRSVNDSCGSESESSIVRHADTTGCTNPLIRLSKTGLNEYRIDWEPFLGVAFYNAYRGSVASLWSAGTYDHERLQAGLSYPTSPTPADGCDAASGANGSASVVEGAPLADAYYLVVSVLVPSGEQEYGADSSGSDRRDPAVDPRDGSFSCP